MGEYRIEYRENKNIKYNIFYFYLLRFLTLYYYLFLYK